MQSGTPKSDLMTDMLEQSSEAAALMKTLSNQWRLLILCLLVEGEKSVTEIERQLDTKQPNVSQQLARLRMEGYVSTRRDGRTVYYKLADDRVKAVIEALHCAFCPI